jgi:hypothetical protein
VLGVHGVWNYRPQLDPAEAARALSAEWAAALPGDGLDVRVVYYAHLLRTSVPQGGGPDGLSDLPPDIEQMILDWAGEFGVVPADVVQQGPGTVPIRWLVQRVAAACALNPALTAGLQKFVGVFFREVAAYLRVPDSAARTAVRDCVAEAIAEHRPDAVLAHSLGSVVAYEALLANPSLSAPLLVTMGSPLGMPAVVYDRLQPAQPPAPGIRPPNVGRWINISDPGDLIAVPRPFTTRFSPDENHDDEYIHLLDFHLVGHYLRAPATARALAPR